VNAFAYSPDGNNLAVSRATENQDLVIQLLEIDSGKPIWTYNVPLYGTEGITAIAFSPDGSLIAAGGWERVIFLLDARSGKLLGQQDHYGVIFALGFSRDGQRILAAGCGTGPQEEGLTVWNFKNNHSVRYPQCIDAMTIAPITPYIATDTFSFINYETGKTNPALPDTDWNFAFSPDGKLMATGIDSLAIWNLSTKTRQSEIPWTHYQTDIAGLAWSAHNMLAILSEDGTIVVWNMSNLEPVGSTKLLGADRLAFSPDGTQLAGLGNKLDGPLAPLTIWKIRDKGHP
jgi:WD40 repeat protein